MHTHFTFTITKKEPNSLMRAGVVTTPHGQIQTPAFVVVGTKATVKGVTPEMIQQTGAQVVLANTYHLYLQPGDEIVRDAGGFPKFMGWNGPTMTDSGGFQVFSLGAAYGTKVSKVAKADEEVAVDQSKAGQQLCHIDEEGVTFKSHINGSLHRLTPERSMEIQWNLGADMIFAFDECTSPQAPHAYQTEALDRTHRWAKRSLARHEALDPENRQALFGVVQGGRFEDLRRESAQTLGAMNFDGFGIGGSFNKDDMATAVAWVNEELPEEKPRHLLGIGEPADIFAAVENGCDLFDCVTPTRHARHGLLYTYDGPINLLNSRFKTDHSLLDPETGSYTGTKYTKAYLAHLYRSKELLAATLGSVHNIHFMVQLVSGMRQAIVEGRWEGYRDSFLRRYYRNK